MSSSRSTGSARALVASRRSTVWTSTSTRARSSSVIGPNGAGKTSFFNVISGMFPPDGGEILFDGTRHRRLGAESDHHGGIARTFQNVRLFPNMTVLENIMVAQHCRTHRG